jgi:preprotein translocase subunit SecF/SecD/SecF fusion protein
VRFNINFVKYKNIFLTISAVIVILGIVSLFVFGLNLGIDFTSGSRIEISLGQSFTENEIIELLKEAEAKGKAAGITDLDLSPSAIMSVGNDNDGVALRFDQTIESTVLPIIKDVFASKYGENVDLAESKIDPTIAQETARNAIFAVLAASIGIVLYITVRFEYRFAISGIIALLYDAFFIIAAFSILRIEVDMTFIAAVLTIVGYSINDTIVIFDRIRENMKNKKIKEAKDLDDLINYSLNQTLMRTINTTITVVVVALALFLFGSSGIKNFSFALMIGLISGAYSSLFIASQLWLMWRKRDLKRSALKSPSE